MKSGIRIIAIDDSKFSPGEKDVLVVGVVERLGIVEGVLSCRVEADGSDATAKIIGMLSGSRFLEQIRLIAMNGTTVAGMNLVDITRIHSRFGLPVMAVTRKRPHPEMLKRSMASIKNRGYLRKAATIDRISEAAGIDRSGGFYVQHIGIEKKEVSRYIKNASESLRLAHMIASGVVRGESKGRL
jgi:hypothetical protein